MSEKIHINNLTSNITNFYERILLSLEINFRGNIPYATIGVQFAAYSSNENFLRGHLTKVCKHSHMSDPISIKYFTFDPSSVMKILR